MSLSSSEQQQGPKKDLRTHVSNYTLCATVNFLGIGYINYVCWDFLLITIICACQCCMQQAFSDVELTADFPLASALLSFCFYFSPFVRISFTNFIF